jgi:glucose-6-phosphate isomerase
VTRAPSGDPSRTPEWQTLAGLARDVPDLSRLLDADPDRFASFAVDAPRMLLDLSRQRWTPEIRSALLALARARSIDGLRRDLFRANRFNPSEDRAVLHTALRAGDDEPIELDGVDIGAEVRDARTRVRTLADDIRSGRWRGAWGAPIRNLVHIGIGGSFLGPALVCEALGTPDGPRVHFLANVDGHEAERLLPQLDPGSTLFVIASKSFGTLETRTNAEAARSWFLERGGRPADLARHFVAVTTNTAAAAEFGLPEANLLPMWDWVGGRFSLWSPIGLPIAAGFGNDAFDALLDGARAMDVHFRDTALEDNAPALLALAELWNQEFLGTRSHAVLPYATPLARLPDFLQQLEMESNGKNVRSDGTPLTTGSGTIVWGNVGTNGQHAYHQLLHQGTQPFSAEFILPLTPDHRRTDQHDWLAAHCFAQAEALARGRTREEVVRALEQSGADPTQAVHRVLPGNHPSSTVLLDDLGAASLGALIALHEHKVFVQGMIWGVNSFDQWGVEQGKVLGDRIHAALVEPAAADGAATPPEPVADATTRALVRLFRARRDARAESSQDTDD